MRPLEGLTKALKGSEPAPQYLQQVVFALRKEGPEKEREFNELINAIVERAKNFSSNEEFWRKLLDMIEQAQVAAADGRWIEAQQSATQASVLVNRAIGSESLNGIRTRLAFAPFLWFFLLFFVDRIVSWLPSIGLTVYQIPAESFHYMWMGMLGGTTIVWWGIVKHAKDLTFDSAFVIWYFLKPALGAIMGVVVVLILEAGFVTLNGNAPMSNRTPLLVVAFIGGFSERFFINMIDKVVSAVLGGDQKAPGPAPRPAKAIRRPGASHGETPVAAASGDDAPASSN
jgi:hypothetical protein